MESLEGTLLDALRALLPGFLVAWVFFGLTGHYRPSQFERVVQALIFSLFARAALVVVHSVLHYLSQWYALGEWSDGVELVWSVVLALSIGILMAWAANTDRVHGLLRRAGITKQTSHPTEWYGALSENARYIALHLTDGRRITGWPNEWPNQCDKGHFVLKQAAWLGDLNEVTNLPANELILIKAVDVEVVELLEPLVGESHDSESSNAPAQ